MFHENRPLFNALFQKQKWRILLHVKALEPRFYGGKFESEAITPTSEFPNHNAGMADL
jgi:hypothetical protein